MARRRSWSQKDRATIKDWAIRRARSEIRRRMPLLEIDEKEEKHHLRRAKKFIDNFASSKLDY